jgi:hypothetical protein
MERIKSAMIQCALRTIPRGQVKRHRPFWNATLTVLKRNRNNARKIAERSGRHQYCINLKRKQAQLRQAIIQGKRTAYRSFISRIDFRKDGIKAHRFVSNLNNQSKTTELKPVQHGEKSLTEVSDIANALCSHYASVSRIRTNKTVRRSLKRRGPQICLPENDCKRFLESFKAIELEAALTRIKLGKAAGPDEVFPELLRYLGPFAKKTLLALYNLTWTK